MNVVIINRIKKLLTALAVCITIVTACMLAGCTVENEPPPADENKTYSVIYAVNDENGGFIRGDAEQQVTRGGNGKIVTAVALGGYVFTEWSDGYDRAERQDKNINMDLEFTAKFERRYAVSYLTTGVGRIDGKSIQKVKPNGNADSVTAVPDDGYEFVGWSDGHKDATRTDKNVVSDLNVAAIFTKKKFAISYSASNHGRIDGKIEQIVEWGDSAESVTATPDIGFEFSHWSDGFDSATRTDKDVRKSVNAEAIFKVKQLTAVYDAGENGSIEGEARQTVLYGGSATVITAKPHLGYEFISWSDGVTTASRTDTGVKADINVTAKFGRIVDITVKYGVAGGGRIDGKATQTVAWGGNAETVIAVAADGYKFVRWSDGVNTAQRHDENIMPESSKIGFNAIFEYDNPPDIEESLLFSINSEKNGYSVKARNHELTEIVIPRYYNGLPVTAIMDNGFSNCSKLTTVFIPDTLKRIGVNAFVNCSELVSIGGMSNVETIGNNAFAMCEKLDGLVLPKTLKSLGRRILFGVANRVYTRLTVAELNALNPEWNDKRADGGTVEYIGDGEY